MNDDKLMASRQGTTLVLTLNIPQKRNAIDRDLRVQLMERLQEADEDNDIRAIVITGSKAVFCSGGDLSSMNVHTLAEGRMRMNFNAMFIRTLVRMRKPVIAAVEGFAAGAGLSLALACDFIVSSESARYVASFGKVGLIPDLGLLYTLPRRVNPAKTKQILFFGEVIEAMEAKSMGLVDYLVPKGEALTQALSQAERLSSTHAPLPLAMIKMTLAEGLDQLLDDESAMQAQLFLSADHIEGKKAFFEKRVPIFKGA